MTDPLRTSRLQQFVDWVNQFISGDEKGQAQIFLDRFFQALGHEGSMDVGGTPEFRVRKDQSSGGGVAFADYVWKPFVLIEMKKRGENLQRHYRQAFDYWINLVPGRPRYTILCNFDEFWIYDFETQMDTPVDFLPLNELPTRYGPIAFLFPIPERPVFGNDHEQVTRDAADKLARCFNKLINRRVPRELAQRFILQILVALFSEDIGLLEKYLVIRLLEDCSTPKDSYDLLGGLFEAMNSPQSPTGGRFKGVRYFNGGLFDKPSRLELHEDELNQLREAAKSDWSKVRPEIFGTLLEHSLEKEERHAFGGHFTHPTDIMKIVGPTIVEPWRNLIDNASTVSQLEKLRQRMQTYRVLDPACGSGNFLYIAYRELKRLEARLFERIGELSKKEKGQRQLGFVTANQFFGMDINPFAVEIAKVTMMIARKLAIDELHVEEQPLPLHNLDGNFIAGDALIVPYRNGEPFPTMLFAELNEDPWAVGRIVPASWPNADVIIGNPPFLGAKRLKPERGADYVNAVRNMFPEVPGMADYCVYWFRLAHDHLPPCTPEDPVAGRAGLVGTQNIRNNQSRVGGLDYIVQTGTIVEAVDNQPWSGEANVHVSIVNWVKHADPTRDQNHNRDREGAVPPVGRVSPARTKPGLPGPQRDRLPISTATVRERESPIMQSAKGKRVIPPVGRVSPAIASHNLEHLDTTSNLQSLLIPAKRKIWFKVDPPADRKKIVKRGEKPEVREFELRERECIHINSALSHEIDVTKARILDVNAKPKKVFNGQFPRHQGFVLTPKDAKTMIRRDRSNSKVVHPFLIGRVMVTKGSPDRWVIDFQKGDIFTAAGYQLPFRRIKDEVLPHVSEYAKRERYNSGSNTGQDQTWLNTWWQHFRCRKEMVDAIRKLRRYIACPELTKRPIFCFVSRAIRPDHTLEVFSFDDDYSFGILQSSTHWKWFVAKCSKLKSDFRYTPESVFDTFPWPQKPKRRHVRVVVKAGRELRSIRLEALGKTDGGLRAVYRNLELPGKSPLKDAHAELDAAVLDAYGFSSDADLLQQLLDLNLAVADRIDRGQPVTPPGIPLDYPTPDDLVTDDCIRPE